MDSSSYRSLSTNTSDTYSSQPESGFQSNSEPAQKSSVTPKTLKLRVSGSQRVVCCAQWNFGSGGTRKD